MKILLTFVLCAFISGALLAWAMDERKITKAVVSLNTAPLSEITLTDQDHQTHDLSAFYGKTVMLNFMFNGCSPVQTVGLRRVFLDHELDRTHKNITFLSISVAPETDTPEQLKRFAERYGIDSKHWRLGITNRQSLEYLLKTFNAGQPVTDDPNTHLNTVFLINPTGQIEKVYTGFPINIRQAYTDLATFIPKPF